MTALILVSLSLTLAGYLLYCLRTQELDLVVTEMLIEEMVSQQPVLLAPPRMDVAVKLTVQIEGGAA